MRSRSWIYAVLKSTGSAFENFVRDEFTTLVEVNDRIFSTSIDMSYVYTPIELGSAEEDDLAKVKDEFSFDKVSSRAREITLDVFAIDESASVQVCASVVSAAVLTRFFGDIKVNSFLPQATLFKMGTQIVSEHAKVLNITYKLPNKHYIPVDMKYINIDNMTPLSTVSLLLQSSSLCLAVTIQDKVNRRARGGLPRVVCVARLRPDDLPRPLLLVFEGVCQKTCADRCYHI